MRHYFQFIFRFYGFWLIFFSVLRIYFLLFQLFFGYRLTANELLGSIFYGIYMDLAFVSFIVVIPFLIYFINKWIPFRKVVYWYSTILIALIAGIYAGDISLYREWGFRLDKTAFSYLDKFQEAGSFISVFNILLVVCFFCLIAFSGTYLYQKIFTTRKFELKYSTIWIHLIIVPALIIPMRGGLGIIPMNPGKVYFSTNPFANHCALNTCWNLAYSFSQARKVNARLQFMEAAEMNRLFDTWKLQKDNPQPRILNKQRPKILFFLLESFTAKMIGSNYKNQEITPRLNEWFKRGMYFKQAYSTGDRTEIGLACALSGFPAQPQSSIVHHPRKTEKLPSLIRSLKNENYHSSFYYGGDISFASMNSYLYNCGIESIIDKSYFPKESYNAKWGVHDHILFERLLADIAIDTSLFFKLCLSLSSHPPYDIPESRTWFESKEEVQFLNTAHYTDKYMGNVLDSLSHLPIWDDLLVIVVADHGCRFPGNSAYHLPEKFHIPIWFGGGAVGVDSTSESIVSQNDIAASLLGEMNISNDSFEFSRNFFSADYKPSAYYAYNNGFGWLEPECARVFSNDKMEIILTEGNPQTDFNIAKAFLQKVLTVFDSK